MKSGLKKITNTRLLAAWTDGDKVYVQAKRLPKSATPLAKGIQRAQMKSMGASVIYAKKQLPDWPLKKLIQLVKYARDPLDFSIIYADHDEFKQLLGI
jgi:hypothetical protein